MKIEGPKKIAESSVTRRTSGATGAGFVVSSEEAKSSAPVRGMVASESVANVGALFAAQVFGDLTERRKRATKRAFKLLDELDNLKLATLSGYVTGSNLLRIANALKENRDSVEDSNLQGILDEIELRAEVELAKLQKAI